MKKRVEFWYAKVIYKCPLCEYKYSKRRRRYGEKPKMKKDRVEYRHIYDFCGGGANELCHKEG